MTAIQKFDLAVIGSGPGGYVAAIRAAQLKMKTAIIERESVGGICLNWGCIPTKALLKSAEMVQLARRANEFGLTIGEVKIDFPAVIKRSRQVAMRLSKGVEFLLKKNKVELLKASGRFQNRNNLQLFDSQGKEVGAIQADRFILATGARPRNLPSLELDGVKLISYREAMTLKECPKSLIIIGAGAIGVEFAYFYNAMGSQVFLLEMLPQILPLEDAETVEIVYKSFQKAGIKIATGAKVEKVDKSGPGIKVHGTTAQGAQTWEADVGLVAIGVQANSNDMGLESLGVILDRGFIKVDDKYQTALPGICAIGDVIGAPMLAHAASHEGVIAVEGLAGLPAHRIDPRTVPSCTYCQPQVASLGLTEAKAKEQGLNYKVGRFPLSASGKAMAAGDREGLVKLIFDANYGELIGAHIVASEATEMIAELGLAQSHGAIAETIAQTIHAHPTLSEAVMEASLDALGRVVHV